mmetsp:Transcript_26850/g.35262  ORF Transcript_26850/g.35262 Transcript_26850/m.35262 type:complete len:150 (-) Transcript_26850:38-487(-)
MIPALEGKMSREPALSAEAAVFTDTFVRQLHQFHQPLGLLEGILLAPSFLPFSCIWVIPDGVLPDACHVQGRAPMDAVVVRHAHASSCGRHLPRLPPSPKNWDLPRVKSTTGGGGVAIGPMVYFHCFRKNKNVNYCKFANHKILNIRNI